MTDVLIIGAGPSGLTAALYALRAGLKVTVIEKKVYGGQVAITNKIENYPGFNEISGIELSNSIFNQVTKLGCEFIFEEVVKVDLKGNVKRVITKTKEICSKSVIIANGLKRRKLGCSGEDEFEGKGVSYCATCDGSLFKGKKVCVVGGGNTALEDALYLSNICESVILIVRREESRAETYLIESIKSKDNVTCEMGKRVDSIQGDKIVKSVNIVDKNNDIKKIDVSGVFISIGYEPDNSIYKNELNLDENNYFISNEDCLTNIEGVFVAGDCRKKFLRQIVTAVADGAVAAAQASKFLITNFNS